MRGRSSVGGARWSKKQKKRKTSHHLLTCAAQPGQPVELPRHFGRLGAVLGIVLVEERGRGVAGRHRFCSTREVNGKRVDAAVSMGGARRERRFSFSLLRLLSLCLFGPSPLSSAMAGTLSAKKREDERKRERTTEKRARKEKCSAVDRDEEDEEWQKASTSIKINFFSRQRERVDFSLSLSPSPRFQGEREKGACFHILPATFSAPAGMGVKW